MASRIIFLIPRVSHIANFLEDSEAHVVFPYQMRSCRLPPVAVGKLALYVLLTK